MLHAFLERRRRTHPGSPLASIAVYAAARMLCRVVLTLGFGLRTHRRDRLPADGPVLIVANHVSFFDPPLVGCTVTTRQLDYLARASLMKPGPLGRLIAALHTIPVDKDGAQTAAMRETLRRLAQGHAVVMFPEGTRSPDGLIRPFERGIALLIKRAACPILPVAIGRGAFDTWPRASKLPTPFRHKIRVYYGRPIPAKDLLSGGLDAVPARLEREIRALLPADDPNALSSANPAPPDAPARTSP